MCNYLNYVVRILVDSLQAEQGGMVQVPAHIKHEDIKCRLFLRGERKFFLQLLLGEIRRLVCSEVVCYPRDGLGLGGGGGGSLLAGKLSHANTLVTYKKLNDDCGCLPALPLSLSFLGVADRGFDYLRK